MESGDGMGLRAMPPSPSESDLTPLRAHYLKKSLIQLQFAREFALITSQGSTNVSTLSYLGPPFSPPPKDAPPVDLPFLRYIFRQFVLTFPFMAAAPKDFYSQKLQPFVVAVVSRNLSSASVFDDTDTEETSRKKTLVKIERNLSFLMGGATKLLEPEEVVRLTQSDLDRLDLLSKKRQARLAKTRDIFEINIVSVRTVLDRGRIRNRIHDVCPQGSPICIQILTFNHTGIYHPYQAFTLP
jgi:PX-associated